MIPFGAWLAFTVAAIVTISEFSHTIGLKTLAKDVEGVMILQKDQKIRLNERGLKFHTSVSGPLAPRQNWNLRTGTIAPFTRGKTQVVILWDGNASFADAMPVTFLEPV